MSAQLHSTCRISALDCSDN